MALTSDSKGSDVVIRPRVSSARPPEGPGNQFPVGFMGVRRTCTIVCAGAAELAGFHFETQPSIRCGAGCWAVSDPAILAGYTVQFTTATTLVAGLAKAHGERRLNEKLLALSKPKLLIVHELGYLSVEPDAAHLFFQLVSQRCETGAMLITNRW